MLNRRLLVVSLVAATLATATPARADITAFLGVSTSPSNRMAKGVAFGTGLLAVGFEFEYSDIAEDEVEAAPGVRAGMFNAVLQTPIPVAGVQFYVTAGGGIYRERLVEVSETNFVVNLGGGAKITLLGPIRLRVDYRQLRLRGTPLLDRYHRFYAGLNLAF